MDIKHKRGANIERHLVEAEIGYNTDSNKWMAQTTAGPREIILGDESGKIPQSLITPPISSETKNFGFILSAEDSPDIFKNKSDYTVGEEGLIAKIQQIREEHGITDEEVTFFLHQGSYATGEGSVNDKLVGLENSSEKPQVLASGVVNFLGICENIYFKAKSFGATMSFSCKTTIKNCTMETNVMGTGIQINAADPVTASRCIFRVKQAEIAFNSTEQLDKVILEGCELYGEIPVSEVTMPRGKFFKVEAKEFQMTYCKFSSNGPMYFGDNCSNLQIEHSTLQPLAVAQLSDMPLFASLSGDYNTPASFDEFQITMNHLTGKVTATVKSYFDLDPKRNASIFFGNSGKYKNEITKYNQIYDGINDQIIVASFDSPAYIKERADIIVVGDLREALDYFRDLILEDPNWHGPIRLCKGTYSINLKNATNGFKYDINGTETLNKQDYPVITVDVNGAPFTEATTDTQKMCGCFSNIYFKLTGEGYATFCLGDLSGIEVVNDRKIKNCIFDFIDEPDDVSKITVGWFVRLPTKQASFDDCHFFVNKGRLTFGIGDPKIANETSFMENCYIDNYGTDSAQQVINIKTAYASWTGVGLHCNTPVMLDFPTATTLKMNGCFLGNIPWRKDFNMFASRVREDKKAHSDYLCFSGCDMIGTYYFVKDKTPSGDFKSPYNDNMGDYVFTYQMPS